MNTTTSSRQERIQELEQKISLREDALHFEDLKKMLIDEWIPSEEFNQITTIDRLQYVSNYRGSSLFQYGLIINDCIRKNKRHTKNSLAEEVLHNINVTRDHGERLLWDHRNDRAYQVLEDIQKVIWYNSSWDFNPHAITSQEMSKQRLVAFIDKQKRYFIWREQLTDMLSWDKMRSYLDMKQQYHLLHQIGMSSQDTRDRIFARIGAIISTYPQQDLSWSEICDLVQEESRSKLYYNELCGI